MQWLYCSSQCKNMFKEKSTLRNFGDGDSTGCCPVVTAQSIVRALNQLEATGISVNCGNEWDFVDKLEDSLTPPWLWVARAHHPGRAGGDTHLTQTGHIQARSVELNIIPWRRSFPTARLCPWCCSYFLCCHFGHPTTPTRAISPHRVLLTSDPGHLLVHQLLSVLWGCMEPAYHSVSGMVTTLRGPMQTWKCAFSPGWLAPMAKEEALQGDRRWEQSGAWLIYILKDLKCSQRH